MTKTYTYVELVEALPDLEVGTEFKTSHGSFCEVRHQKNPSYTGNKGLVWLDSDEYVGLTEVTRGEVFTVTKDPSEKFIPISLSTALERLDNREEIWVEDDYGHKVDISAFSKFEDASWTCEDFYDVLDLEFFIEK